MVQKTTTPKIKTKEQLMKEGYSEDFCRSAHCGKCGTKMLGKAETYQPAYDNTWEIEVCPKCGESWSASL